MSKTALISIWLAAALLVGCESIKEAKESDEALSSPVNCATAEGDLRVLEGEKAHAAGQKAAGATMISPVAQIYGGGPTGGVTEDEPNVPMVESEQMHIQMEVDRYQQAVDAKIAEIKATCGL